MRRWIVVAIVPCGLAMLVWWTASSARGVRETTDLRATAFVTRDDGGPGIDRAHHEADARAAQCWFVQRAGDTRAIRCPPGYLPRTGLDGEPLDAGGADATLAEVQPPDQDQPLGAAKGPSWPKCWFVPKPGFPHALIRCLRGAIGRAKSRVTTRELCSRAPIRRRT